MDIGVEEFLTELAVVRAVPPVFSTHDIACSHALPEEEMRIRWRIAWYERLAADGWQPPEVVLRALERDRALLGLPDPGATAEASPLPRIPEPPGAQAPPASTTVTSGCNCEPARNLREAFANRAVIEQAKGMLMAQQRCDAQRAFRMLVAASQASNRKLRDLAAQLVAAAPRAKDPAAS